MFTCHQCHVWAIEHLFGDEFNDLTLADFKGRINEYHDLQHPPPPLLPEEEEEDKS